MDYGGHGCEQRERALSAYTRLWARSALACMFAVTRVAQPARHACAANYLEVADIETVTTGDGVATADAQTDGFTPSTGPFAGVFLPLNQFHFHTPSEHTINGVHYPLEMHMVHKLFTSDGTLTGTPVASTAASPAGMAAAAVIGIMFAYECAPCMRACLVCSAASCTDAHLRRTTAAPTTMTALSCPS